MAASKDTRQCTCVFVWHPSREVTIYVDLGALMGYIDNDMPISIYT